MTGNCAHIHLKKVANMNATTYRCRHCHELFDIPSTHLMNDGSVDPSLDLSKFPYRQPKPVYGEGLGDER